MVLCSKIRASQGRILLCGLAVLFMLVLASPAIARSPTIKNIQSSDTIFLYERNLDISALHGNTGSPVVYLKHYSDFTGMTVDNSIAIGNENSYTVLPAEVGGIYGAYYAWNAAGLIDDGSGGSHQYYYVDIQEPLVTLGVVLADPYHVDSVEGLTISQTTPLAFRITSPKVGSTYHVGNLYPAQVSIVLIGPAGAETTLFGGVNHVNINVSATQFYSDDPGRVGSFTLEQQDPGTYQFQAKWTNPLEFAEEATDSNIVSFTIRGNPTTIPATSAPTTPPTVTTTVTTPPTTVPVTTVTVTTIPTTQPTTVVTTVPVTTPPTTAAPLPAVLVLAALGAVAFLIIAKKR